MITPEEAREKLVALTQASGNLWKAMQANSAAFHYFHEIAWPRCTELADDGEPCILAADQHRTITRNGKSIPHMSAKEMAYIGDDGRAYHLQAGRVGTMPYVWALNETKMVAVTVHFEDSMVGRRVVAWVRAEDMKFFPEVKES